MDPDNVDRWVHVATPVEKFQYSGVCFESHSHRVGHAEGEAGEALSKMERGERLHCCHEAFLSRRLVIFKAPSAALRLLRRRRRASHVPSLGKAFHAPNEAKDLPIPKHA